MQIVAASGVKAGQEVHNTYGELGSAELVAKYGFALPPDLDNPFDAVTLDKGSVLREAGELMSARALRARCRFLAEERCARSRLPERLAGACRQDRQGWCHLCMLSNTHLTLLYLHSCCLGGDL